MSDPGVPRCLAGQDRSKGCLGPQAIIQELEAVPSTYFKKLEGTDDIWECRVQLGSNIYRFLGFFFRKGVIILTHGFSKKSQKTPRSEIERAESYKKDFMRRHDP